VVRIGKFDLPWLCALMRFGMMALGVCDSVALLAGPAQAQTCSADVQCANGGRSMAYCSGDTLIVKRSQCNGTCQEREERRETCAPRVLGAVSCAGNIATRTTGGCDSSAQRCNTRQDREVCVKSCACVGKRLIVSTGQCLTGAGCARSVVQCKNGCTCGPEPQCL
jgi:hypothetical protein